MKSSKAARRAFLIFVVVFTAAFIIGNVLAQFAPRILAFLSDRIIVDQNNDGFADPGDLIQYTAIIANCEGDAARNVVLTLDLDPNVTQEGAPQIGVPQSVDGGLCGPARPAQPVSATPTPAPVTTTPASAANDTANVTNGAANTVNLLANDSGVPAPVVVSFGGPAIGNAGDVPADGTTTYTDPSGIIFTLDAAGNLAIDATALAAGSGGTVILFYTIDNGISTSTAQVTVTYGDFPTAQDDTNATMGGAAYTTPANTLLTVASGTGLLANDTLGTPSGTLTLFGGGDASAAVSAPAGSTLTFGAGSLTVNADGSFNFTPDTGVTGIFTFQYTLANVLGSSTASVEINILQAPVAAADTFSVSLGTTDSSNNVLTNDALGAPPATVDAPGTYPLPASGGITVTTAADGSFTIDATAGTALAGTYTFDYQISNAAGSSIATVTINVTTGPVAQDDLFSITLPGNISGSLAVDNGSGADTPGVPPYDTLTFGGGSLAGSVTDNAAGAGVALAGGTLTVNLDGTFSLNGATIPGQYTFLYRLTESGAGLFDDATVTINLYALPVAVDDGAAGTPAYSSANGSSFSSTAAAGVRENNDSYTLPTVYDDAVVDGYGTGFATTPGNPFALVGSNGATVTLAADGTLTIDATAAGVISGEYSFDYRITNSAGSDTAVVWVRITEGPVAQDDLFSITLPGNISGSLSIDNGSGADTPGVPPYDTLTFGGGSLAGSVTDNAAGASVALAGGTLTVNLDGTFSLNGATAPGQYTFLYRLTESGSGLFDDATVTINLYALPVAVDDGTALTPAYTAANGGTSTSTAAAGVRENNDSYTLPTVYDDAVVDGYGTGFATTPGNPFALVGSNGATVTLAADGTIIIDATAAGVISGEYSFDYRITNSAGSDTAVVWVRITEGPVAQDDLFSITLPGNISGSLSIDNGSGADTPGVPPYDTLTFGGGSLAGSVTDNTAGTSVALAGGTLTVNLDGSFSLNGATAPGQYTFLYRLSESGAGLFDDATVTINLYALPVAVDDGTALTPAYTAANGGTSTSTAAAGVRENNDSYTLPTVYDDAVVDGYGTGFATTPGNPFALVGSNGATVTLAADGTITVDATAAGVISGEYSFDYRITNSAGSDTALVWVRITEGPVAQDDLFSLSLPGGIISASLTADNGSGADTPGVPPYDTLTFGGGSLGGSVTDNAAGASVALAGGTLTVNLDGSFSLPGANIPGQYTFLYRLTESGSGLFDDATVTINLYSLPVAVDDGAAGTPAYSTANGSSFTSTAAAGVRESNDSYTLPTVYDDAVVDGYGTGFATTPGNPFALVGSNGATVTLAADGTITVDATAAGVISGEYSFDYRITNSAGSDTAVVWVWITEGPVAEDDAFTITLPINLNGNLTLNNGSGPDTPGFPPYDTLTFGGGSLGGSVTDNPAGASVLMSGGTLTVNLDGTFSLSMTTPGQYTFLYRLTESGSGLFDDATVTFTIYALPIAVDDGAAGSPAYTTANGSSFTSTAAAGVRESNDSYTLPTVYDDAVVDGYGTGFATLPGNPFALVGSNGATVTLAADGTITVDATAAGVIAGEYSFDYRITNSAGSDTALVTVAVSGAPDGFDDTDATVIGGTSSPGSTPFHLPVNTASSGVINVLDDHGSGADIIGYPSALSDAPADVIDSVVLAGSADAGTGTIGGGAFTIGGSGSLEISGSGALNLTPPTNFTGLLSFEYTLANSIGTDATPALVTFAVGDRPQCTADGYAVTGNVSIQALAADGVLVNDSGSLMQVTAVAGSPANVGVFTATTSSGSVMLNSDGTFIYSPPAGFTGADTVTYTIDNGFGSPQTCAVTFTVTGLIWFIDDNATPGGDGTRVWPWDTIAAYNAAATNPGDAIFVFAGNYTGPMTPLNSQIIIGEGATSSVTALTGITFAPLSINPPTTGGIPPAISGDGIVLADSNQVYGLNLNSTVNAALRDGGASIGTTTVADVNINTNGAAALNIANGGTLNASFGTLSAVYNAGSAVNLVNVSGTITNTSGTITSGFTTGTAIMVNGGAPDWTYTGDITKNATNRFLMIQNTTGGTLRFTGGTLTHNLGTGIRVNVSAGSLIFDSVVSLGQTTRMTNDAIALTNTGPVLFNGNLTVLTNGGRAMVANPVSSLGITNGVIDCDGNIGNTSYCFDVQNSGSAGVNITSFTADHNDALENGGGIRLLTNTGNFNFPVVNRIEANNVNGVLIANSGTVVMGNTTAGPVTVFNRAAFDVSTSNIDIQATTVTVTNSTTRGISLNATTGTRFHVTGDVAISTVAGALESVRIANVTTPSVQIGVNGGTPQNVSITNRNDDGIFINNYDGGAAVFGNVTIGAPLAGATGNGVFAQFSSSSTTINQLTVNMTGASTVGGGNGLQALTNPGAITVTSSGSITNAPDDALDMADSGPVTINNMTVTGATQAGLRSVNMNGASTYNGLAISGYAVRGVDIENTLTRSGSYAFSNLQITGAATAVRQFEVTTAGGAGNVPISLSETVAGGCSLTNSTEYALYADIGTIAGDTNTVPLTINGCDFGSAVVIATSDPGSATLRLDFRNNTLGGTGLFSQLGIAGNGGTLYGTVENNIFNNNNSTVGILAAGSTANEMNLALLSNTMNYTAASATSMGIVVDFVDLTMDTDVEIRNNTIGSAGVRPHRGIVYQADGAIAHNNRVWMNANTIYSQNDSILVNSQQAQSIAATVENNVVTSFGDFLAEGDGIEVQQAGTQPMCLDLRFNNAISSVAVGNHGIQLENVTGATYQVEGPGTAQVTAGDLAAVLGNTSSGQLVDTPILFNNNVPCTMPSGPYVFAPVFEIASAVLPATR